MFEPFICVGEEPLEAWMSPDSYCRDWIAAASKLVSKRVQLSAMNASMINQMKLAKFLEELRSLSPLTFLQYRHRAIDSPPYSATASFTQCFS